MIEMQLRCSKYAAVSSQTLGRGLAAARGPASAILAQRLIYEMMAIERGSAVHEYS